MQDRPYTFDVGLPGLPGGQDGRHARYDAHVTRTLSALRGQFSDGEAYAAALARGDAPLYDVYELVPFAGNGSARSVSVSRSHHARCSVPNMRRNFQLAVLVRPAVAGELLHGLSVVHPGKVGDEYYMTKGHFHAELATAEIYYCLRGRGLMVMETPEGAWAVEPLAPGKVLYVLPRWAHRSVNTGAEEDLVTFFVYPGNAGHDYGMIERQGFRKLVVEREGVPCVIDNPHWGGVNESQAGAR